MPPSTAVKRMYRRGPHYKVAPLLGGNEVNMGLQHSVKYRGIGKKGVENGCRVPQTLEKDDRRLTLPEECCKNTLLLLRSLSNHRTVM